MFLSLILSITLAISPAPAPSTSDIPVAESRDQLAVLIADGDITAGLIHVRDGPNQWSDAVGVRDLASGKPAVDTGHFRIGNVTKGPYFAPGTSWRYSNTNYVVVGLLIEKLTGHAYGQEVARRILSPLKLTHTSVPGNRASLPTPHAHGYEPLPTDPPTMVDATRMDPSLDWAAGEMISTTRDLATFVTALLDGRLTSRESLAEM